MPTNAVSGREEEHVVALLIQHRKMDGYYGIIQAILYVRTNNNELSLKEAKELVEGIAARHRIPKWIRG